MDNKDIEFNLEIAKCKLGFSVSKNLVNKIANATSTLFAPATAWLQGKQAQISCSYLPFYDKLAERKNENLQKLFVNVLSALNEKELRGEKIPDQFEDTDNLLLIQDNASTTSNEDFLKLWAKLYTEEACKPGSISRKTIKLLETLDTNIVKIFENEVLPYCDANGYYWGTKDDITNIILLMDYGLIENSSIMAGSKAANVMMNIRLNKNYTLYIYPNYVYGANYNGAMFRLTVSGVEIFNNLRNDISLPNNELLFNNIKKASEYWGLAELFKGKFKIKKLIKSEEKFIICDNDNNVAYPKNSPHKTYMEFYESAMSNIEEV